MNYLEHSQNKIKENGGRITKTKLAVLQILSKSKTHLKPYEIAEKIQNSKKKIDVVTVYRILEKLEQLKLVHKSKNGFMACAHYECKNSEHCHHQFLCNKCKEVFEVHINDQEFLQKIKNSFENLLIKSHDFHFSGLCKKCQ